MVIPRSRSSGALSIVSKARYWASPLRARYFVIAAVRLVLPWSMWPIVPTLTCGFVRSNFFLAIGLGGLPAPLPCPASGPALCHELRRDVRGDLGVVAQFHRIARPTLRLRPQVGRVAEHLGERDEGADDLRRAAAVHALDLPAPAVEIADDVAHELLGH